MVLEQFNIQMQKKKIKSSYRLYFLQKLTQNDFQHKTIKILEDNVGANLDDLGCGLWLLRSNIRITICEKGI